MLFEDSISLRSKVFSKSQAALLDFPIKCLFCLYLSILVAIFTF